MRQIPGLSPGAEPIEARDAGACKYGGRVRNGPKNNEKELQCQQFCHHARDTQQRGELANELVLAAGDRLQNVGIYTLEFLRLTGVLMRKLFKIGSVFTSMWHHTCSCDGVHM